MATKRSGFGPWSTSLDAGSRMELSAFWKRRLAALTRLPAGSQRMGWRCLVAALATIALLAATPMLQWMPEADAADEKPKSDAIKAESNEAKPGSEKDKTTIDAEPQFAEVIERAVNDNGHGKYLIDFDSGKVFEKPDGRKFETEREFLQWARSQGIDAMGQVSRSYKGLLGFDMVVVPTDSWTTRAGNVVESLEFGDPGTPAIMDARAGLPATFFIETREGARGVLQITSIEEDNDTPGPDKVHVRFKPIAAPTKRLVFRPEQGEGESANWSHLFERKGLGLYMLQANVPVGGKFPVRLDGSEEELFSVEMVSGTDKALSVRMIPPDGDAQRLWLERDQPVDVVVGGEKYTLTYPTSRVAAESEGDSKFAHVMVTWQPRKRAHAHVKELKFGPVVERVVSDDNPKGGKFLIDFETGELHSPPADLKSPKEQFAWIASRGIDATGELSTSIQGLIGFDMIVLPTIADNWNPSPAIIGQVDDGRPGTPATFSGRGELPATFLFKTREGARGVLQITENVGHEAVKIRYKLATEGGAADQLPPRK